MQEIIYCNGRCTSSLPKFCVELFYYFYFRYALYSYTVYKSLHSALHLLFFNDNRERDIQFEIKLSPAIYFWYMYIHVHVCSSLNYMYTSF